MVNLKVKNNTDYDYLQALEPCCEFAAWRFPPGRPERMCNIFQILFVRENLEAYKLKMEQ